ncbi:MAG: DUF86 domain-containing protein [Candidatus Omnitrophica bacterium]|nr:DUF86 domain-containing protein [Candidatus Omnitrophota bacterium]
MKRNYKLFIEDILGAMNRIEEYIKGLSYEDFSENEMVEDAVIRKIEIIGEAARNVPEDIKEKYQNIPWKKMVGLRNITIHEYFGVDLDIVWEIITKNIPETKVDIQNVLEDMNRTQGRE